MVDAQQHIYLVEDDATYQKMLRRILADAGRPVHVFDSAERFLGDLDGLAPGCLVLDIRLPAASGLDLQQELRRRGKAFPIVFITGHAEIPTCVQAIKFGAVDFLTKPVRGAELLSAVQRALNAELQGRQDAEGLARSRAQLEALTDREREVFQLVVIGLMNKEVADKLGASERTVKAHRAQVMQKMGAQSLAELVRIAQRLEDQTAAHG